VEEAPEAAEEEAYEATEAAAATAEVTAAELPRRYAECGRGRGAAARDVARGSLAHRPTPLAHPM
jgi:hypothetical protein